MGCRVSSNGDAMITCAAAMIAAVVWSVTQSQPIEPVTTARALEGILFMDDLVYYDIDKCTVYPRGGAGRLFASFSGKAEGAPVPDTPAETTPYGDVVWKCGNTTVAWTEEEMDYSSGSSGIRDQEYTIMVDNPPPGPFKLKFHTTAHAIGGTWWAEMDGEPCKLVTVQ
jgi:hypothetical protein